MIESMVPDFDSQQNIKSRNANSLDIVSSMARLAVITKRDDAGLWTGRFQKLISQDNAENTRYGALLYRLQAQQLKHEGINESNLEKYKQLLNKALDIYRRQAYRRGIAAGTADIEFEQQHWKQSDDLYRRSLKIHLWTLNKKAAIQVLSRLIEINRGLGNVSDVDEFSRQLIKLKQ